MSYRGTVKNGIVVLEAGVHLPEGQPVVLTTELDAAADSLDLPAFGIWSDRTDMSDAAAASLQLRRETERRTE